MSASSAPISPSGEFQYLIGLPLAAIGPELRETIGGPEATQLTVVLVMSSRHPSSTKVEVLALGAFDEVLNATSSYEIYPNDSITIGILNADGVLMEPLTRSSQCVVIGASNHIDVTLYTMRLVRFVDENEKYFSYSLAAIASGMILTVRQLGYFYTVLTHTKRHEDETFFILLISAQPDNVALIQ